MVKRESSTGMKVWFLVWDGVKVCENCIKASKIVSKCTRLFILILVIPFLNVLLVKKGIMRMKIWV